MEGLASIEEDSTLKKFWNNSLKRWLLGPEDPNYVLIKINPDTIYYIDGAGTTEPEFYDYKVKQAPLGGLVLSKSSSENNKIGGTF